MTELDEVIEHRELEVKCWHCDWRSTRTLNWLSCRRDMNCPLCTSVIVLDTSVVRREIVRERRQLSALHAQMVELLDGATKIARRAQPQASSRSFTPKLDLELARSHPDSLAPFVRPAAMLRRARQA